MLLLSVHLCASGSSILLFYGGVAAGDFMPLQPLISSSIKSIITEKQGFVC